MRIYIAGDAGNSDREIAILDECSGHRLLSYHSILTAPKNLSWERCKARSKSLNIFMDSGAFSGFTQGVEIDLDKYIDFLLENEHHLGVYCNLDVIGDAEGTLDNQHYMEDAGLCPLPTYHYGEPLSYLERYIEEYDYVALGGVAAGKTGQTIALWLDDLFAGPLTDKDGVPVVKTHGFGITSLTMVQRYPWYSVDSTSWLVGSSFGTIFVPRPWKGMLGEPWKVKLSRDLKPGHFSLLSPRHRAHVLKVVGDWGFVMGESTMTDRPAGYRMGDNEKANGSVRQGQLVEAGEVETILKPGLCNRYQTRDQWNVRYYRLLEEALPDYPWAFEHKNRSKGFGL